MNTETYLIHVKSDFVRRVSLGFIISVAASAAAFAISYLGAWLLGGREVYSVTPPISAGGASETVKSAVLSQLPNIASLTLLLISVFTVMNKWITALLCAWRGACLGCSAYLTVSGAVVGISEKWGAVIAVYFLSTVLFAALAAISRVYSEVICRMYAADEKKYAASVGAEFLKLFLVISGGIFILGCISVILI